ncbi:TPA: hypothetical protein PEK54_001064 [Staphylococcus aureus]|nr:hypothetical protein [Staphylococcus aureus]
MDNKDYKKFYLIREDVLPESVVKTLKIKDALKSDPTLSIYDAVKQFDLSRMEEKATITLSLNAKSKETSVEDVIGALRNLDYVSKVELISMSM